MSGEYKSSGFGFIYNKLDPMMQSFIESQWEEQTDQDTLLAFKEIEENKHIRGMCLMKTILFPLEIALSKMLLNSFETTVRIKAQSFYWRFLRKKITLTEFKKEILDILK